MAPEPSQAWQKTIPTEYTKEPTQTEYDLQKGCHQHFREYCPSLVWKTPEGKDSGLGWMNKNDGKKGKRAAGRDKAQGLTPGVPDWQLAVARQQYHGLLVEFKTHTGTASNAQKIHHQRLREQGYLVIIIRSLEAFGRLLQWYLGPGLYLCHWPKLTTETPTHLQPHNGS